MNSIFVILIHDKRDNKCFVSKDGYKTLKEAQYSIEKRVDKPLRVSEYKYENDNIIYTISNVLVQ